MKKFRWFRVYLSYIIAFSILAFCITLPLGITGFASGYIGWAIMLPMIISEMDDDAKEAIKKWATKHKEGDDGQ